MESINVEKKFGLFHDLWGPKIIAEWNGQQVVIVKIKGEFVWHSHKDEDELFFVMKGTLKIELRDKTIELNAGEMTVIPKNVEHKPVADEEVWLLAFQPMNIKHVGDLEDKLSVEKYERL